MQTLAPHQQRVVVEHRELTEKVTKLAEFTQGDVYAQLPSDEKARLARQLSFMRGYADTLSERIAAFNKPLASAGFEGMTTLMPGICMNHASTLCECWAAAERIMPSGARSTSGTLHCAPNI